jgi:ABC-type Co2+ transport system permease subunit
MDWDFDLLLWPIVYLFWTVALIFSFWGILRRKSDPTGESWKELLAIAAFCLVTSLLMLFVHYVGLQISFTARLGIVSLILGLYAYYLYRRQKN